MLVREKGEYLLDLVVEAVRVFGGSMFMLEGGGNKVIFVWGRG